MGSIVIGNFVVEVCVQYFVEHCFDYFVDQVDSKNQGKQNLKLAPDILMSQDFSVLLAGLLTHY